MMRFERRFTLLYKRLASSAFLLLDWGIISSRGGGVFAYNVGAKPAFPRLSFGNNIKRNRRFSTTAAARATATALFSSNPKISISDAYDGGNIDYSVNHDISQSDQQSATVLQVALKIKPDPYTELEKKNHFQYFSFRSTVGGGAAVPTQVSYSIENAGDASYAEAWDEFTVFYSTSLNDPDSWRRKLNTEYKNGKLVWSHEHSGNGGSVYFCYFPPFSYDRHLQLIEKCSEYAKIESLGHSLDGRDIECVKVGSGDRTCWIIHRQHPGEHMAEFFAEGLLTRLLGLDANGAVDGLIHKLLKMYTFYIVPSMNPDGAIRGHLRTNACGANLNREWTDNSSEGYKAPTAERSPEVLAVLNKMDQVGCDAFIDVHGDEGLPYNFLAQAAVPNWGARLESLHGAFLAAYCRANPDMQQTYAYEAVQFQQGDNLNIASDQIAARFDCLSVTLEMPFKDCWSNPDPERGWNPARARKLGASVVDSLVYIHPYLRSANEFWNDLPEQDSYVVPTSKYK